MPVKTPIVSGYARTWPREVFDRRVVKEGRETMLARTLDILKKPGIYILYRDNVPYYVGKATKMRSRLWQHAWNPQSRHYNLWDSFSFFVVEDPTKRNELEGILIAAMPTANGARPKLPRERLPKEVTQLARDLRISAANPSLSNQKQHVKSFSQKAGA
jgi:hypothetical protein